MPGDYNSPVDKLHALTYIIVINRRKNPSGDQSLNSRNPEVISCARFCSAKTENELFPTSLTQTRQDR